MKTTRTQAAFFGIKLLASDQLILVRRFSCPIYFQAFVCVPRHFRLGRLKLIKVTVQLLIDVRGIKSRRQDCTRTRTACFGDSIAQQAAYGLMAVSDVD